MTHRAWILLAALGMMAGCGGEEESGAPPASNVTLVPNSPSPPAAPEFPSVPGAWVKQTVETDEDFTAIAAIDENRAWVADAKGHVYQTVDGGATWTGAGPMPWVRVSPFPPPNSAPLRLTQLQFVDELHGWGLGPRGVVSTSNGGESWTLHFETWHQNYPSYASLYFISPTTGWVSFAGQSRRTTDGGETWTEAQGGTAVHFSDSQSGWHVAGQNVYRTVDQGQTWQFHAKVDQYSVSDLSAVDEDHAWVLANGHVYGTKEGNAWNVQQIPGSARLQFVDTAHGWVIGTKILHTSNGGAAWTVQTTPFSGFNDFAFVDASVGWIVGDNGLILKTVSGGQ